MHHVPWQQCHLCRSLGFRCGGTRRAKGSKASTLLKDARHKAKLQRLAKPGGLGEQPSRTNSGQCSSRGSKKNFKKNIKKRNIGSIDAKGSIVATQRQSLSTAWPSICDLSQKRLTAPSTGSGVSRVPSDITWNPVEITSRKRLKQSMQSSFRCRGDCPTTNWSIDQYCERCHG